MTLESVKMYNTLIDICAKTGALSVAESLYEDMMLGVMRRGVSTL